MEDITQAHDAFRCGVASTKKCRLEEATAPVQQMIKAQEDQAPGEFKMS